MTNKIILNRQRQQALKNVMNALNELEGDMTVPKNIKDKVQLVRAVLQEKTEVSLRIDKALQEFEEISDDINLQPFTRTQIWNVVSMLEKV